MKNVIIKGLYGVGMHHWGARELSVGSLYYLKHEHDNPKDPNAIAVYQKRDLKTRACYLRRTDAHIISKFFKQNMIEGPCYLKAKAQVEKWKKSTGPQQRCNIGFKCRDGAVDKIRDTGKEFGLEINIF
jgi:hypothetical protein